MTLKTKKTEMKIFYNVPSTDQTCSFRSDGQILQNIKQIPFMSVQH